MQRVGTMQERLNRLGVAMIADDEPGPGVTGAHQVQALRQVTIFANLDDAGLETLRSVASHRSYRRRELITQPHADGGHCWVIVQGTARVYQLSSRGQEVTIERLGTGDIYGLVLLEQTVDWTSFLEATTDGTIVYRIPLSAIEKLCLSRPQFALSVLRLLSRRLTEARAGIEDFALHDTKARLAHTLARLAADNDEHLVTETHRELASLVGTRPEDVTRLLRQLREEDLVAYRPGHRALVILDVDRLASYGS